MGDIKNVWEIINPRAGVLEIRAFTDQRDTRTELFHQSNYETSDDLKKDFEARAKSFNEQGLNVYVVMNSIRDDLESGSCADADIAHRDWLLIDIDRVKPTGAKHRYPAGIDEIKHAVALGKSIESCMAEYGWPQPVRVFSGNGIHAYYPLSKLPNDDDAADLLKRLLRGLASEFDNEHVEVDTSVHNASRLTKVIGTIARKGQECEGRKYRVARLIPSKTTRETDETDLLPLKAHDVRKLLEDTVEKLELANPTLATAIQSKAKPAHRASNTSKKNNTPPDDTPNNNALLIRMLNRISADCGREDWKRIVFGILSTGFAKAEEIAYNWSAASDRYTDTDFNNLVRDYREGVARRHKTPNGVVEKSISMGSIYHYARAGGYTS
jgi:hypothetical protein